MPQLSTHKPSLGFVSAVSNFEVLRQQLMRSPCFQTGQMALTIHANAASAAQAFNDALQSTRVDWLVWVHQDVYLPTDWEKRFVDQLLLATHRWPQVAVAGVYGVQDRGDRAQHVGHVLDRGRRIAPQAALPCLADSLDELLFAVRVDSGLAMDPALGFDFYATDLVLQAQARGRQCVVVDAFCEHWSSTPTSWPLPPSMCRRIQSSAEIFEAKWAASLPVTTSCFDIRKLGDVATFLQAGESSSGHP